MAAVFSAQELIKQFKKNITEKGIYDGKHWLKLINEFSIFLNILFLLDFRLLLTPSNNY